MSRILNSELESMLGSAIERFARRKVVGTSRLALWVTSFPRSDFREGRAVMMHCPAFFALAKYQPVTVTMYGMIISALIMTAAMTATPSGTSPKIFGLTIGQPMPYAECPEAKQSDGTPRKRDKHWQWIYDSAVSSGAPCFQRWANKGTGKQFDPIEYVQVSFPEILKIAGAGKLGVMIVDGKLASIGMPTDGEISQDADLATLIEKFGHPTKVDRDLMHNGFGVRFSRIHAVWDFGGGVEGEFLGFRNKRTEGGFGISTSQSRVETERQLKQLRKVGRDL